MVFGDLFKLTAKKLRVPENKGDVKDSNSTAESENELEALCASCVEIGKELITHLEAPALYSDRLIMGVEATRIITRGWGSLWAAVQFAFTSDEMEALKRRLSAIREAIELRDKIDANALRTSSRFDNLDMKTQQVSTTILDCRFSLEEDIRDQTHAIAQMLCRTELAELAQNDKTRAIVLDVLRQSRENGGQSGSSPLSGWEEKQLSKFKQEEVDLKAKVEGIILDALSLATMTDRLKEVPEPHARTCRWIFENPTALTRPWTSFNEWLQGDEGLYWINGKAASGKSTLLRYIYLSPRTRELLTSWAMPFELQTASFFFWNSGTLEQRSQTGFLRALLFELLQSQQDFISTALPLQWARVYSQLLSYSNPKPFVELDLDELMQALQILAEQTVVRVKLFLLIDGLDEYEGNFEKIGELLCKLAKSPNIKICVSSRPLLVFEDAFDGYPSLRLQDLTYQDITNYMSDELGNYPRFRSLASKEPLRAPELIREVVTKANGVFLWVYLVVQSLISGLANRDTIADLQRRLRDLPPKLEDLYSHMLDRIDRFYISKASEMFQLVRAQRETSFLHGPGRRLKYPFTIFALAMADQDNVLETTNKQPGYWSTTEIIESCSDMEDRLKVRSAGLLEVQRHEETENSAQSETLDWQAKVLYIHWTARDYIESPEVWNNLLKHTSETNFDAHYSLFRSGVLQTRLLAAHTEMVTFNTLGHIALQTMGYSSTIQWKDSTLMCNLLDKLDEGMSHYHDLTDETLDTLHWMDITSSNKSHNSFLSLAIQYELTSYVHVKIESKTELCRKKKGRPLLDYAVKPTPREMHGPISAQTVAILLKNGSDPNQIYLGKTVWLRALLWQDHYNLAVRSGQSPHDLELVRNRATTLRLMLEYNADPQMHYTTAGGPFSILSLARIFMATVPTEAKKMERIILNPNTVVKCGKRTRF